jgi:hypothetical protein
MPFPNVIQGFFPNNGRSALLPPQHMRFPLHGGKPLPPLIQRRVEAAFGTSFADVRVHVGPHAAAIGALAFTHGANVYFAPGHYDPHSARGQRMLWHELTHVVQQKSGRVRNPFGGGIAIVHDRMLEAEAERMSLRATHTMPVQRKAGSRIVQPLLMFTYPAGTIVNSPYTEEYLEGIGKVAVTYRGVTVYTDPRNQAETRSEIDRRFTIGTLSAVPAESDLEEVDAGVRPLGGQARLLILKTFDPDTIGRGAGVYVPGKVFYRIGENGAIHHLSASIINRYWDLKYSKFARLSHPDWRYNCGDYALSDNGTDSVDDEDTHLGQHFTLVCNLKATPVETVKERFEARQGLYVVQTGYHYFRLQVGVAQVVVSQKDGDSGVYSATMSIADAAKYCYERVAASAMRLYMKN